MSNDDAPKDGDVQSFRTRRRTRRGKRRSLRVPVDEVPRRSAADDVTGPTSEAPMPAHSRPPGPPDEQGEVPMDADTVPGSIPAPPPTARRDDETVRTRRGEDGEIEVEPAPSSEPVGSEPAPAPSSQPAAAEGAPSASDVPPPPGVPSDVPIPEPSPEPEEPEERAVSESSPPRRDSVVVRGTVRVSDHPSAIPSEPPPGEPEAKPAPATVDPTQEIELPDDARELADFDSEPPSAPAEARGGVDVEVEVEEEVEGEPADQGAEDEDHEVDIDVEAARDGIAGEETVVTEPETRDEPTAEEDVGGEEPEAESAQDQDDDGAEITIEEASPEEMAALGVSAEELELDIDEEEMAVEGSEPPSVELELDVAEGELAEGALEEPEPEEAEELDLEEDAEELGAVPEKHPPPTPAEPPPAPEGATDEAAAEAAETLAREAPPPPPQGATPPEAKPLEPRPRRRRKPWWEDFFNDDYLRTVRPYPEKYVARQCDFIEYALGLEKGATILDVGCGLGLQAVELAARGYLVVGLDLSLPMLSRAADEAQDRGLKINFLHADMREMTFDGAFDAVLCWGTTLGYFDEETNRKVIERLYRALKPMGLLLIDVVNRDHVIRAQPNLVWFEGDGCVCMEETQFNYITSRLEVKRTVILDDGRQRENLYTIRLYSLNEIGRILHDQGFRVAQVSGHEAHPGVFFGADSPRMIIMAERRMAKGSQKDTAKGGVEPPPPPSSAQGDDSTEEDLEELEVEPLEGESKDSVIPTLAEAEVEDLPPEEEEPRAGAEEGEASEPSEDAEAAPEGDDEGEPDGEATPDESDDGR